MKKTRLFEIIREEIAGALNEKTALGAGALGDPDFKKAFNKLPGDEKAKVTKGLQSGTETFVFEEDLLNEIPDFGGQLDQGVATKYGEEDTLQTAVDAIVGETLADMGITLEDLKKDEAKATEALTSIREKVLGAKRKGIPQDPRFENALEKQQDVEVDKFGAISGKELQSNQTNNAIKKALGLVTPDKRGPKADPNKPKPEKAPSTGKRGRPAGSTSAGKTAVLTPGDDGFDTVSYNEPEEDEAVAAMGGDETAKELGQAASVSKDENFDRIRTGLMKKARAAKGELSAADAKLANQIINTAKEKYKFNATQIDALRAVAGL